ncbi:BrnT family toxin [Myxococcota bacterium]|nr:BrnT family toxin [Myxococcota bacterium]
MSVTPRVLVVVHCHRDDDVVIRIISARRANREESRQYTRVIR